MKREKKIPRFHEHNPKYETVYTREAAEVCLTCDKPTCSGDWRCFARRKKRLAAENKILQKNAEQKATI